MAKKTKEKKGNWIVRMEVVRVIEIRCTNCTREQAESNPWDHCDNWSRETDIDQRDWEVESVEEDE